MCYVRADATYKLLELTASNFEGDWSPPKGLVPAPRGPSQWVMGFACEMENHQDKAKILKLLQGHRGQFDPLALPYEKQHAPGCVRLSPRAES